MIDHSPSPAVYRLQRVLDSSASRHEIVEALESAQASASGLPELLLFRANERVAAERMLERRRILFAVGSMIVIFATVVGGFGLTTLNRMRSLNQSESIFAELVRTEQWDEASRFLQGLDDTTRSNPVFVEGQRTVTEALAREEERAREFKRLVAQLRAGPADDFDPVKVQQITDLAKTAEEQETATEINEQFEEQRLRREASRTDGQTSQFQSLQDQVDRFLTQEQQSMTEDERQLRRYELQKELNEFVASHHLANPELAATAKQTVAMLSQDGSRDQQMAKREQRMAAITDAVGNLETYLGRIKNFVADLPGDAMSSDLGQTLDSPDELSATLTWIRVLEHPGFQDIDVDSATIEQWFQVLREAERVAPQHPFSKLSAPLEEHLIAVQRRKGLIAELRQEFASDLMKPMYVYPGDDQEFFYSEQDPSTKSDRAHVVPYFADLTLSRETKNYGLQFRQQVAPRVRMAGHSRYAAESAATLSGLSPENFTPSMYRLINGLRVFQGEPEFDPVYRVIWMRKLMRIASDGSVPLRSAFGDWQAKLSDATLDATVDWISPQQRNQAAVLDATRTARALLQSPPDWDSRVQDMLAGFKRFQQPRPKAPRWVGWVAMQDRSRVAMLVGDAPSDGLVVVSHGGESNESQLVSIDSSAADSVIRIDNGVRCGSMVYSMTQWD
ncbi:phytochrome family protein [Stieleria varia]|uniref:Uncharacterized protein n=1 Tax=Stieleria varia TaxID=2528005 RepID=A0A5C6B0S2_9BACT|nr:hypothetical protein [Stieleria varia]TWU05763.1 hypothetical protein Pla52n_14780 [Stieleria varia]